MIGEATVSETTEVELDDDAIADWDEDALAEWYDEVLSEEDDGYGRTEDETAADDASVVKLDDEEMDAFLRQQSWGSLTLAKGDVAYSIPMSFGWDGDSTLYFLIQTDDGGEKMSYLDATETASFLVPEVHPPEWTSVMARGEISRVPEDDDDAYAALADNAWFPLNPWTADKDPSEVEPYKLEIDDLTGRASPPRE